MSNPIAIPEPIVREHIAKAQELMREHGLAALQIFQSSNMLAYAATPHSSTDRLTCAAVTADGELIVVCPAFERPAVASAEGLGTIHTWEEHEDPFACFAGALRAAGVRTGKLGLDGRTWLQWAMRFEEAVDPLLVEPAEHVLREVRICKTPAEQEVLREAHRKGERAFLALRDGLLRPGVREIDLCEELFRRFEDDGIVVRPLIQSGPNGSIPHNPTGERELQEGDTVVIDSVIRWCGYHNDITRTFAVGTPSDKAREAYQVVRRAQAAAIEAARPGVPCARLDEIARKIIADAGFRPYFTHRLGHGMGLEGHEPPYLSGGETEILRPGMCCTVEPGIYVPGEFGIRIEDDILITADGCEVIHGELPTDVSAAFEAG